MESEWIPEVCWHLATDQGCGWGRGGVSGFKKWTMMRLEVRTPSYPF